jgi:hypothetical protein
MLLNAVMGKQNYFLVRRPSDLQYHHHIILGSKNCDILHVQFWERFYSLWSCRQLKHTAALQFMYLTFCTISEWYRHFLTFEHFLC